VVAAHDVLGRLPEPLIARVERGPRFVDRVTRYSHGHAKDPLRRVRLDSRTRGVTDCIDQDGARLHEPVEVNCREGGGVVFTSRKADAPQTR